jgi:hypothetical protein
VSVSNEFQLIQMPKPSNWKCHVFGSSPGGNGMVYYPSEGNVPNRFVRWMMKICFACTWVYTEPPTSEENLYHG